MATKTTKQMINGKNPITIDQNNSLYPKKVKELLNGQSPKTLSFLGNASLLNKNAIGFCGSRKASNKGLYVAEDCAMQAVANDIVVVSGNATGVDTMAHLTSLKNGGETIFVLPEGINNFKIKKELEKYWDWDRVLVVSQFAPDDSWQVFRAMNRNKLIIALSKAMIVIEASEKGGTIKAGQDTIKLNLPLYVVEYNEKIYSKGNEILMNKGGRKLQKSPQEDRANMKEIFESVNSLKPVAGKPADLLSFL